MVAILSDKEVPLSYLVQGMSPGGALHATQTKYGTELAVQPGDTLFQTVEDLRRQLVLLVQETGSFTNESVVKLSQLLDQHVYEIQLRKYKHIEKNLCSS
ncbi:aspartyl-phosphate phosphatase Spo0E family protein [Brevibacillus ruminantium]|uniref:Aspartyl-phosphate phosphatase Spo0E family protein n=1 Tax=Brevibacillus ruminantium TaxID=2950604 RepID=A0ABY4WF95_9BACL|nr:aspartyl-phosphate phosphatase Spo0E family protein [Brevibacillus ruminantium]USG65835.1 aspartyl-phosphate phosphatase Spo0E family protein [Brevibacillus ruminantium]